MSGLTAASAAEMRVLEELRQHEAAGVADTALRLREMDQARLHLQASVTRLQEDWEEFSSKHQVENATVTVKCLSSVRVSIIRNVSPDTRILLPTV